MDDNGEFARGRVTRRGLLGVAAGIAAAPLARALLPGEALAAAPQLGLTKPGFARFRLGAFELTMLPDSDAFIDGPFPIIGENAAEADVQRLMIENLLPPKTYQPGFTPMVVNTGKELVIFDTGNGANGFVKRPDGGWLAAQLAPAGFTPDQIDVVVLSHGHIDHVGGIMEGGKPLFPNARYVIAATEYDYWAQEGVHTSDLAKLMAGVFRTNVVPVRDRISFIKPGDDVVGGIRSMAAPGHTPGHLAFMIESDGKNMLFWGDCAHHQVASLARPDWHCMFDSDKEQGATTRKRIYDLAAAERIPVQGYHMPFPSLGYVERRQEGGYRWLAHTYQLSQPSAG
ncbi:MBL fold metallo-hydrolase [Hyphomicrobium sp. 1Nfss2.1]|uniref:MBL fold metallo-hydrolase n=1 Tax=Hyphomicrobium sp. 1Nfss2.1 TaxID=3413936 RepID=UPI003C7A8ACF